MGILHLQKKMGIDSNKYQAYRFVFSVVGAYGVWKVFSFFLEYYDPIWWKQIQNFLASKMVMLSSAFLQNIFDVSLKYNSRNILIDGAPGIYVADHCLGIPAMVVFSILIAVSPGKVKNKIWYIPTGILGIFLINTTRTVGLGVLQKYSSPYFWELNHSYTFLILTYGLVFLMVKFWMDKFDVKQ
jgi:exosortase/archaeosortase family protein